MALKLVTRGEEMKNRTGGVPRALRQDEIVDSHAFEWKTDYKPCEEGLAPQEYAEHGYKQGMKKVLNTMKIVKLNVPVGADVRVGHLLEPNVVIISLKQLTKTQWVAAVIGSRY